jgi:hypothetical protein
MRNLFWTFTEVMGWIRIAVVPFIVGSVIGAIILDQPGVALV